MPCTDADLDKFYPVDSKSTERLNLFKTMADRQLYCIDWDNADIDLYGSEASNNVGLLEIVVVPCNQKLISLGGFSDRIDPECTLDLEGQKNYFRAPNWIMYYN